VSTVQSQQLIWPGRTRELPTSSKQQPGSLAQRRPMGVAAGLAALVLAALAFSLVLCYAAACALTTRNGYAEMNLRREIEDLRAETALLSYQIHLAESDQGIQQAALRLSMRAADPVQEIDYVLLPHRARGEETQLAADNPTGAPMGVPARLAELVGSSGGQAEASTGGSRRP
jgi:hypothetical protein